MNVYLKKNRFAWAGALAKFFALAIIIAALNLFSQPVRTAFFSASALVSGPLFAAGSQLSGTMTSFWNIKELSRQNSQLSQQNNRLLSQVSDLEDRLRYQQSVLQFNQNSVNAGFSTLPVRVIGLTILDDTLVIDKGSADGVANGMPVISQGDVIFGKVEKTYAHTSVVLLISARGSVVNVKIQQSDTTQPPVYGAVKGQGNFSVYLDLVPSQNQLHRGDVLVTSALDGVFPADLPVGEVLAPYKNNLNPFQQASVQPLFDPQDTDILFIITNHS